MWRTAKPLDRARRRLPARARAALAAGVEAQAGDEHEDVPVVGVDRDPLARPRVAVAHEQPRGERPVEQAGRRQGERDRARAVVAVVAPGAVAAAPLVGELRDRVAGEDHPLDDLGRVLRRHGGAVRPHAGARAGGQEGGRVEVIAEAGQRRAGLAQLGAHLVRRWARRGSGRRRRRERPAPRRRPPARPRARSSAARAWRRARRRRPGPRRPPARSARSPRSRRSAARPRPARPRRGRSRPAPRRRARRWQAEPRRAGPG